MLTEKEAKKTACCAGHEWPHRAGYCIGSACMAWREAGLERETIRNYRDEPTVPTIANLGVHAYPDGWQYEATDRGSDNRVFDLLHRLKPDAKPTGYCGLAGRPE